MNEYDVIIIGAGPGGYVCAIRASQLGLKTAIIDKEWLGGVCLNVGCIPTKALLKNAEIAHTLRERAKEFGVSFDNLQLDYAAAVKRSRRVSKRLIRGVNFLMKKNNIDVFMGTAKFTAPDRVQVTDVEGKSQDLKATNIVVATGTHPFPIPGWEIDGKHVLTYRDAILQETLPASAIIIGAGPLGVEFATIWNAYGSKVTLVEMLPNVLPLEDEEISVELEKSLKKRGIEALTSCRVQSIDAGDKNATVTVSYEGGEKTLEAEQVLVAIGFKASIDELDLEAVGVELDKNSFVVIDEHTSTNVPGIWAIGDVTGKLLLAHVASRMGILCADNIAGKETNPLDYLMIPSATYCHPQVASFGMTEAQAVEAGHEIKVGRFPFLANGKALGLGESVGFTKIITDAKNGRILGSHMIGPEATELLPELTLAQRMELTAEDIAHNIHAHPTLSETVMEAAEAVEGHAIHM
ncbi:MAG TPA: dihydrolipoyl dehydrogenase [Anaerolineae bacterium]|nr:dihydrolipoyl dehydrogenase [Anaerolineae bacterium]